MISLLQYLSNNRKLEEREKIELTILDKKSSLDIALEEEGKTTTTSSTG